MKRWTIALLAACMLTAARAQETLKKVYNEELNPVEQIDAGLKRAKAEGKYVVCQVGGNWCPWCLRFADFIQKDSLVKELIEKQFVYLHVDYNPRKSAGAEKARQTAAMMKRLNNPARFGFPVLVVLNENGEVIHTQDSGYLEEGKGYDPKKVLRFFQNWTPEAVKGAMLK